MPRKKHDRESIIETLRNVAQRLGKDTLSKRDVASVISPSSVARYFGSVGNAIEAAGLRRRTSTDHFREAPQTISLDELFQSVNELESRLGHEPRLNEYNVSGRYSFTPFKKRFGKWADAMAHYRKWKAEIGASLCGTLTDDAHFAGDRGTRQRVASIFPTNRTPAQLYGEPIDFRGLRHAPINEQGVVYVFGMVSRELSRPAIEVKLNSEIG